MKIVLGGDEAGFDLKNQIKEYLEAKGYEVVDTGCHSAEPVLYPLMTEAACEKIVDGECERGILVCGTGIGMAMTANKIPGIRAAVGHDIFSVERAVLSNNAQVICFGARIVAFQYVTRLVDRFLELSYIDGPSTPKIECMTEIENKHAGR